MPFAIPIWLPTALRQYALRLFAQFARSSRPLLIGRHPIIRGYGTQPSQALRYSARQRSYRYRHNWNRTKTRLYGSLNLGIPVTRVIVPAYLRFQYATPINLPIPQVRFGPARASAQRGLYEMQTAFPPQRQAGTGGIPPEVSRRRHDSKIPGGINRIYQAMHNYVGRPSEYIELQQIFQDNISQGPMALLTALAINEAIETSIGSANRLVRDNVYRSAYYNLPIGLQSLWTLTSPLH